MPETGQHVEHISESKHKHFCKSQIELKSVIPCKNDLLWSLASNNLLSLNLAICVFVSLDSNKLMYNLFL